MFKQKYGFEKYTKKKRRGNRTEELKMEKHTTWPNHAVNFNCYYAL